MTYHAIVAELNRYSHHRIRTGGFLRAVLANDLFEAFGRADDNNIRDMHEIVRFVYNKLPSVCWGSYEKVDAWLLPPILGYTEPTCPTCSEPLDVDEDTGKRTCSYCEDDA